MARRAPAFTRTSVQLKGPESVDRDRGSGQLGREPPFDELPRLDVNQVAVYGLGRSYWMGGQTNVPGWAQEPSSEHEVGARRRGNGSNPRRLAIVVDVHDGVQQVVIVDGEGGRRLGVRCRIVLRRVAPAASAGPNQAIQQHQGATRRP